MKKYLRATEYVWMALALLCVGVTTYYFIMGDNDNGVFAMVVTLFAGIMYSLRRRFNRHVERVEKRNQEEMEKAGKSN
jgi:membrane protein implicated in regulation of membrane protease activity